MRILAFHLLNNYTGSPKVLSQLIKIWRNEGFDVHITTSKKNEGFLSNISGITYHANYYKFYNNPLSRFISLLFSQILVFFKLLFLVKPTDTIYINTILPFSAALAGKIKRCRVIYHLHETSTRPIIFKRFLMWVLKFTATDVVYVSEYLADVEKVSEKRTYIIHNCIDDEFYNTAKEFIRCKTERKNVLMVSSLKAYKGVEEFIALSKFNPHLHFRLILSASEHDAERFAKKAGNPVNVEVYGTTNNLHPHYQWADIVLNLSDTYRWIETFGLTVLEGMAYGLPAIVPPVGGVTALVENDVNGYCISSKQIEEISQKINFILSDDNTYNRFSETASIKIENYRESNFYGENLLVLNKENSGKE
ncbi:MAG TPA: glycosyltransferase family 4 protein [Tenuifilaceae bacterium]|nr:glycosyltransferase family 4 protein [Tenuifilaceae bacterium]